MSSSAEAHADHIYSAAIEAGASEAEARARAEGAAQGFAEGVAAVRQHAAAIMALPEAVGRMSLAGRLAGEAVSLETAAALLSATPAKKGSASAADQFRFGQDRARSIFN